VETTTVSRRLAVRIGRESLHSIEAPESFEATGDFAVAFDNHGRAVHVHLAADDALAGAVSIPESNHLVDGDGALEVPVRVGADRRVEGELEVVAAYGAESASIPVAVGPEEADPTPVDPGPETRESTREGPSLVDRLAAVAEGPGGIPPGLAALTALAAVAALAAALFVGGAAAVVGVVVLLAGVLGAVALLATEG
jgi:hypothetical protein